MSRFFLNAILPLFCFFLLMGSGTGFAANAPSLDDDEAYFNEDTGPLVPDPLEGWNRAMYHFNDGLIDYVLRPAHKGYVYITPKPLRTGIRNVFHNLAFPARFVNNLLQGKGMAAGAEMSWFILNTTAGLGGLLDLSPQHPAKVPVDEEDMGQTFGVWGIGEGMYIVWPFLGPSTLRDTAGMGGDYFLDPVTYVEPWELSLGLSAGRAFNDLDNVLDLYDDMKKLAVEPYTALRNGYVQYRRAKVAK